jgi:hypothetical protein
MKMTNFDQMVRLSHREMEETNGTTVLVYNGLDKESPVFRHRVLRKFMDGNSPVYVLAERPYDMMNDSSFVTMILAYIGQNYVTWMAMPDNNRHYGNYFGGNYEAAMKDFLTRNNEELLPKAERVAIGETDEWQELRGTVDGWKDKYSTHMREQYQAVRSDGFGRWDAFDDVMMKMDSISERNAARIRREEEVNG